MRSVLLIIAMTLLLSPTVEAQEPAAPTLAAIQSTESSDGPLRKLFTTIVRDVKKLPSAETRPILVNGALLAISLYPVDEITTYGASSSKTLKAAFGGVGKALGREWVQGGVALGAYVAGRLRNDTRLVEAGGDLIEAQLVSVAVTQATKFVVQRTRPDGEARSFPSGHASAAFATATVLQKHYGAKVAIPAYVVAVYTSASRLQANSHYISDVVAGAAIGMAVGRIATLPVGRHRLQITPAPVDKGVAVVVAVRD